MQSTLVKRDSDRTIHQPQWDHQINITLPCGKSPYCNIDINSALLFINFNLIHLDGIIDLIGILNQLPLFEAKCYFLGQLNQEIICRLVEDAFALELLLIAFYEIPQQKSQSKSVSTDLKLNRLKKILDRPLRTILSSDATGLIKVILQLPEKMMFYGLNHFLGSNKISSTVLSIVGLENVLLWFYVYQLPWDQWNQFLKKLEITSLYKLINNYEILDKILYWMPLNGRAHFLVEILGIQYAMKLIQNIQNLKKLLQNLGNQGRDLLLDAFYTFSNTSHTTCLDFLIQNEVDLKTVLKCFNINIRTSFDFLTKIVGKKTINRVIFTSSSHSPEVILIELLHQWILEPMRFDFLKFLGETVDLMITSMNGLLRILSCVPMYNSPVDLFKFLVNKKERAFIIIENQDSLSSLLAFFSNSHDKIICLDFLSQIISKSSSHQKISPPLERTNPKESYMKKWIREAKKRLMQSTDFQKEQKMQYDQSMLQNLPVMLFVVPLPKNKKGGSQTFDPTPAFYLQ